MYLIYFSEFLLNKFSIGPNNLLKDNLSKLINLQSVSQLILAALGSFLIKASSPKYIPFSYSFTFSCFCPNAL